MLKLFVALININSLLSYTYNNASNVITTYVDANKPCIEFIKAHFSFLARPIGDVILSGGVRNVQSVQMHRAPHFKGASYLSCRA